MHWRIYLNCIYLFKEHPDQSLSVTKPTIWLLKAWRCSFSAQRESFLWSMSMLLCASITPLPGAPPADTIMQSGGAVTAPGHSLISFHTLSMYRALTERRYSSRSKVRTMFQEPIIVLGPMQKLLSLPGFPDGNPSPHDSEILKHTQTHTHTSRD